MDGYSAIAPEKCCKKELQKREKQVGMANITEKNISDHNTRYEATMCPAQILASQPGNTILKSIPIGRARQTGKRIYNKKSIRAECFV